MNRESEQRETFPDILRALDPAVAQDVMCLVILAYLELVRHDPSMFECIGGYYVFNGDAFQLAREHIGSAVLEDAINGAAQVDDARTIFGNDPAAVERAINDVQRIVRCLMEARYRPGCSGRPPTSDDAERGKLASAPATERVALVVDPEFGDRATELCRRMRVWLVQSPVNTPVAQREWDTSKTHSPYSGITTFTPVADDTPAARVLRILYAVNEHHNEYSCQTPWRVLEVYGASPTEPVRAALQKLGVTRFEPFEGGFTAIRP